VLDLAVLRRSRSFRERLIRGKSDLHRQLGAGLEELVRVMLHG